MKKFLSLVLALVMTMSLVTVSAGAKDFEDNDAVNYEEAVAVMSEVKVIDGYADGSFKPQGSLTRGAAAKIICNLILGPTTAAELSADTAPFADVPVDHTFAGYIAYCAKEGIINGYADGQFKPANPLTGYAFMKMLLGALGYDAQIEGFVGPNWSINVAKQALAIGLNKGLDGQFNGVKNVNREEACLYALNTLKATMVEYASKTTVTVGGSEIVIGNSAARDVEWGVATKYDGNIEKDTFVQFAEKYFPKLELEVGEGIYGRPANTWKNKKAEIGTFTSIDPTVVYTESTKGKDVYKDLGKVICDEDEYTWTAFLNGKEVDIDVPTKNDDETYCTGEGMVTEIYVDDSEDAETVTVVMINNYLGQVAKVKSDKDGEYISVNALSDVKVNDKVFYTEGFEEDDYVVFTVDYNDDGKYVIGEVFEAQVSTGNVSRVEQEKNQNNAYLRVDGEKFIYSDYIVYDLDDVNMKQHPELDEEYDLYLDPNGYVLGFAKAGETTYDYLYVLDSDEELLDWEAKVVLSTGELTKVAVDEELSNGEYVDWNEGDKREQSNIDGKIWKYTVDEDGVYTLTPVAQKRMKNAEIHNGKAYVTEGKNDFIVDKKTTFVDVDGETAYEGYKAVPNISGAEGLYVMDGKVVEIMFILDGEMYDVNSTYFMIADATDYESLKHDGKTYREYKSAYVNGEQQTLVIEYNALKDADGKTIATNNGKLAEGTIYQVKKTVDEDYVVDVRVKATTADFKRVNEVGDDAFWLTDEEFKSVKYDCDEETVFVYVEKDLDGDYFITEGNIDDLRGEDDYITTAYVVKTTNDETARLVYIFAKETVANMVEVSVVDSKDGVTVVTEPVADQVLAANILLDNDEYVWSYPGDEATYLWIKGDDTVVGTESTFTVTSDMAGAELSLVIISDVYAGVLTWNATVAE